MRDSVKVNYIGFCFNKNIDFKKFPFHHEIAVFLANPLKERNTVYILLEAQMRRSKENI